MKQRLTDLFENRAGRHIVFWLCWIFGFTFVKSFGRSYEVYLGWFSYYIMTLPIFVAHTYLVAYVLIPRFFSRKGMSLFVALFLGIFYGFSVVELILSHEIVYKLFPTGTEVPDNYLLPGNVARSGLGNLYIVLVFLAAKTVRDWVKADNLQKELKRKELKQQIEETMTRVQPLTLLYAIDHIDEMVERSDAGVTKAIALTSELLSEVMMYHEEKQRWISREIELVKKLVDLVTLFRGDKPEVEFFISGDPGSIQLPPMILFSFVDLVVRRCGLHGDFPELNIEASGFSNMISIQVLQNKDSGQDDSLNECMEAIRQLEANYSGKVNISYQKHGYGCSVVIRSSNQPQVNAIQPEANGVDTAKTVDP